MRSILLTFFALGALTACGRDAQITSRQISGSCSPSPYVASPAGTSCSSPQNCTEVCCLCPRYSKQFSAQGCIDDTCGSFTDVCEEALAKTPSLCEL